MTNGGAIQTECSNCQIVAHLVGEAEDGIRYKLFSEHNIIQGLPMCKQPVQKAIPVSTQKHQKRKTHEAKKKLSPIGL